ncbi:MAG TPA: bifunctional DNA primase/polymerase [Streptosporangiaceae bacterium]
MLRRRRRRAGERTAVAAVRYAALGWPVCAGAYPPDRAPRSAGMQRACSCDRIGCPAPGAHPISPAWQMQATDNPEQVRKVWQAAPDANVILVTGRVFDVLDVPAQVGTAALARMEKAGVRPGPVAIGAGNRALFFVRTRGAPADEDEWWSCHLDCEPEILADVAGLRWHCRDSYVLAPPSRESSGRPGRWVRDPAGSPLPDGLRLLEVLADVCEEVS